MYQWTQGNSIRVGPTPVGVVFLQENAEEGGCHVQVGTQGGDSHVKAEAETGAMPPQAKESLGLPEVGKARKDLLEASEGACTDDTLYSVSFLKKIKCVCFKPSTLLFTYLFFRQP